MAVNNETGLSRRIAKQQQEEEENGKEEGDYVDLSNHSVSTNVTRASIEFATKAIRLTDDYSSRTIAANTAISVCLALAIITGLILWLLAVKKPKIFNWLFRSCGFKVGKEKHAAVLLKMVPTMHRTTVQDYLLSIRIPLQNLKISKKPPLNEEDGICIREATIKGWTDATGSTNVVVKTLTDKDNKEAKACLIEQLNILLSVGRHLNIDNLLGVVVLSRPILILEHCPNGTLSNFLSRYRNKTNLEDSQYESILDAFGNYVPSPANCPLQRSRARARYASIHHFFSDDRPQSLNTHNLMDFAYQVVRGMAYLASRRIVHGSLKGQGIYVGVNNILKISDIGLRLHQTEGKGSDGNSSTSLISSRGEFVLKVQQAPEDFQEWTLAPEVLHDQKFSERSDVWAFGVLLYEIFALGAVPDREHSFMPKNVYAKVVKPCWEALPRRRKRFRQLKSALEDLLSPTTLYHYLQLDQPYNEFNEENKEYLAMNQYCNLHDFDEDDVVEEDDDQYDEKEQKDWSKAEGIPYDDVPVAGQV